MACYIALVSPHAKMPVRASAGAAGYDVSAAESATIPPGGQAMIDTGFKIQIPPDCYGRIAPRSGLAAKHGIDVMAGVIDSDYTGVVKVLLRNHGTEAFHCAVGDRIAQLIFEKIHIVETFNITTNDLFDLTQHTTQDSHRPRGEGGFGSTGK